eukprot:jgi/Mesvir1/26223/Mv02402-RA.4
MHRRRKPSSTHASENVASNEIYGETSVSDASPYDAYEKWSTAIAAILLGIAVFCAYAKTASKGITGGDSGELMAVACQQGVAHPPGYPSFVLLSRLALAIPWGQPHQRVALMSSALSAAASVLLFLTVRVVWGRGGSSPDRADPSQANVASGHPPTGGSEAPTSSGAPSRKSTRVSGRSGGQRGEGRSEGPPAGTGWIDDVAGGLRGLVSASWACAGPTWAGLLSATTYASSPLIWMYGNQAEVFALNNACVAGLLYIMARFYKHPRVSTAYAGALLAGFAATNQHTVFLFLLPAVTISLWFHTRLLARPRVMALCLLMVLLGLLPYAHLVVAARNSSRHHSWGATGTLAGFVKHITRSEYGTLRLTKSMASADRGVGQWVLRMLDYIWDFAVAQGAVMCAPAALAGIATSLWARPGVSKPLPAGSDRDSESSGHRGMVPTAGGEELATGKPAHDRAVRRFHQAVLLSWAFYVAVFHYLSNISLTWPLLFAVQARFWQQPNITLFLYVGPGVVLLLRQFGGSLARGLSTSVWVLLLLRMGFAYRKLDRSQSSYLQDVAVSAFESLPPSAIVVASGEENYMPLAYVQSCLGVRRDVSLLSRELLTYPWFIHQQGAFYPGIQFPGTRLWRREAHRPPPEPGSYDLSQFFRANMGEGNDGSQRIIFVYGGRRANHLHVQMSDDSLQQCGLTAYPQGLMERVYSGTCHPTVELLMSNHWRAITRLLARVNDTSLPDTQRFQEDSWEWFVVDDYWSLHYRMAWRMLQVRALPHGVAHAAGEGTTAWRGACCR